MGADMIVSVLAVKRGTQPNFDGGRNFLRTIKIDDPLLDELDNYGVLDLDDFQDDKGGIDVEMLRKNLLDKIDELSEALDGRGMTTISVRDLDLYITGGMSWGDDTDEGNLISTLDAVPGLTGAMGFERWWEETP